MNRTAFVCAGVPAQTYPDFYPCSSVANSVSYPTTINSSCTSQTFAGLPPSPSVIQIAVRPNLRPAVLESLYADEIELTLTTRPDLPVRVVER